MLLALSTTRVTAAADLLWTTQRIEQSATLDQERSEATFHFKNASALPINIIDIRTTCGCTAATLEKRDYSPGEEGDIKAVFNLAGRSGMQEKVIQVVSSDAPQTTTNLILRVGIPEAFTIEPRLLIWPPAKEETVEEKSVVLAAEKQIDLTIKKVSADNPNFEVRLVSEEPNHRYRIFLKPKTLAKPEKTVVRIEMEGPVGRARTASFYGVIK